MVRRTAVCTGVSRGETRSAGTSPAREAARDGRRRGMPSVDPQGPGGLRGLRGRCERVRSSAPGPLPRLARARLHGRRRARERRLLVEPRRTRRASSEPKSCGPRSARTGSPLPESWQAAEAEAALFHEGRDGSNAWALAPSRTTSGRTRSCFEIRTWSWNGRLLRGARPYRRRSRLLRRLPYRWGVRNHRRLQPARLGWATTNNSPTYSQVYALPREPRSLGPRGARRTVAPSMLTDSAVDGRLDYDGDGTVGEERRSTDGRSWGPVIHRGRRLRLHPQGSARRSLPPR